MTGQNFKPFAIVKDFVSFLCKRHNRATIFPTNDINYPPSRIQAPDRRLERTGDDDDDDGNRSPKQATTQTLDGTIQPVVMVGCPTTMYRTSAMPSRRITTLCEQTYAVRS